MGEGRCFSVHAKSSLKGEKARGSRCLLGAFCWLVPARRRTRPLNSGDFLLVAISISISITNHQQFHLASDVSSNAASDLSRGIY